jgi:putative flavoprotein involved in K+ transport
MAERGVTLLGSLQGVEGGRARFAADLNASLDVGDAAFRDTLRAIDVHIEAQAGDTTPKGEFDAALRAPRPALAEPEDLDLRQAGIGTVIWALGYDNDFAWIKCPVLDGKGAPLHRRGVAQVPRLYFLGLPRMHKVKSAFLWGVGEDAAHIADLIHARV